MIIIISIFFIALVCAFGMLAFRAWQLRTLRVPMPEGTENPLPELSFRQVEKTMLYLTKHVVQGIVLTGAKYWFIGATKARKMVEDKLPKVHALLEKKPQSPDTPKQPSFVKKAVLESKVKIRRIRERVKREHEEKKEEEVQKDF